MSLSRTDAELMLRKYLDPDGPCVLAVLLSPSTMCGAKLLGRLVWGDLLGMRLLLVTSEDGQTVFFSLDDRCRFEYTDSLPAPTWLRELSQRNFEGVLFIVNSSGDRLYIHEPRER